MKKILLIGPAGSGKTHSLLDEFVESLQKTPDPLAADFFFILPSAEHTERVTSLLLQRGIKGFFNRRVTTLERLIAETFDAGEGGFVSEAARYFILREIFEKKTWDYFEAVQKSSGFLNLMLSFIAELKDALIPPSLFRERMNALKQFEPETAVKYEALADIYEAYAAALAEKGLRDYQDALPLFRDQKKRGRLKTGRFKKIWLDGFFDFSAVQLAYLQELCSMTGEMTVTLTMDPAPARRDLFEPVRRTEEVLTGIGFEKKFLKAKSPSALAAGLRHIEKNIFSQTKPLPKIKPGNGLMIFEAVGIEGEIEMIARSIRNFHSSGDYRFSDFALLFRQIGDYESVIRSVFARYGIPVEVHERERLGFAPMIRVVVRLLKIFRDGWRRSDLMEFLKSSYVGLLGGAEKKYEWVARLELHAMERGILKGREAWLAPWFSETDERKAFDREKEDGLKALAGLEDGLRTAKAFSEIKRILLHAVEMTFAVFKRTDSPDEYVRRDAASHQRLVAILDEIERSFPVSSETGQGPSCISFESFADRFFRLVELDLYSLHERDRNRVQVYDVSLARQKEYRVVFLAGLLEKKFPVQMKEDPVLSDWERRLLNAQRSEALLKESLPRQRFERYLFYLALTRAREKLILSYPRFDLEGKEWLPSYYLEEVRALFDGPIAMKKQELGRPYPAFKEAVNERELEMAVMGEFWACRGNPVRQSSLLFHLANGLLENEKSRGRFRRAFYEVRDELSDGAIAETGVFRALETSATGLEEYAKCPFRYYSDRVLKLKDPEEDVNVMTRGTILHWVLEKCFSEWMNHPEIPENKELAKADALGKLREALEKNPLLAEKKYQYDLDSEDLRQMIERFLDFELDRLRETPFKPRYFEFNFGGKTSPIPSLEIRDGDRKILIRGKIDRIDVDPVRKAGIVLDYKRTAEFKRADLALGISLQLPIYAMAVEKFLKLHPAAAELYSIRELKKNGFYHADDAPLVGVTGRRLILSEKDFRRLLDRCSDFIRKFSRDMEQMKIPVRPRECPDYCPYAPVCRIEKWKVPLILEEIKEEDARGPVL